MQICGKERQQCFDLTLYFLCYGNDFLSNNVQWQDSGIDIYGGIYLNSFMIGFGIQIIGRIYIM